MKSFLAQGWMSVKHVECSDSSPLKRRVVARSVTRDGEGGSKARERGGCRLYHFWCQGRHIKWTAPRPMGISLESWIQLPHMAQCVSHLHFPHLKLLCCLSLFIFFFFYCKTLMLICTLAHHVTMGFSVHLEAEIVELRSESQAWDAAERLSSLCDLPWPVVVIPN